MIIWLYCICRNEAQMMPYFLRHYSTFVDRMVFYDDWSIDGTRNIILSHKKTELRNWPGTHGIVDDEFTDFANEQWKEARGHAEWVIWVDADEFLYHPNIIGLLEQYLKDGVEVPRIQGFTMLSDGPPSGSGQIYDEIKTGVSDACWSKHVIFRGQIYWEPGRHAINLHLCNPRMSPTVELKLLHYRGLGLAYVAERHARNWNRVPDKCRQRNFGTNCSPDHNGHHGLAWFKDRLQEPRVNII